MVEFFDAVSAHTAMFGSWRLLEIASPALVTFLKDDVIVFEAFNCPYYLRSLWILIDATGIDPTCHEVAGVAGEHQRRTRVFVDITDSGVRHMNKTLRYVDIEAAECTYEVYDLNNWIRFMANVMAKSFNHYDKPSPTNSRSHSLQRLWQSKPKESFALCHYSFAILINTNE